MSISFNGLITLSRTSRILVNVSFLKSSHLARASLTMPTAISITRDFKSDHVPTTAESISNIIPAIVSLKLFHVLVSMSTNPLTILDVESFIFFQRFLAASEILPQICVRFSLKPSISPVTKLINNRTGPSITFLIISHAEAALSFMLDQTSETVLANVSKFSLAVWYIFVNKSTKKNIIGEKMS